MEIEFLIEHSSFHFIQEDLFTQKITRVFMEEGFDKAVLLCVVFMSDEDLLQINKEHLNHDYYTDIITFPIEETEEVLESDMYISIDRVEENAKAFNVAFETELLRVVLHGCLHLCGFGDRTEIEIKQMRQKENYYILA